MRAFQLYFNPKRKKGAFFEIFCYKPSGPEEEVLGDFFAAARLKNASFRDKARLQKIIEDMKSSYYQDDKISREQAFKKALASAEFGEFSWPNLSLAAFSVDSRLTALFSKIRDLKIFVFRDKEIFNLGDNPSFNSSPEKRFSNIMQGSLEPGDKIAVLNEEVFQELWDKTIFQELQEIKRPKDLKKLLKQHKPLLRRLQGFLLFVFIEKPKERKRRLRRPTLPVMGKTPEKISSIYPVPEQIFRKTLISVAVLILLLILGYFLFS